MSRNDSHVESIKFVCVRARKKCRKVERGKNRRKNLEMRG
jgi:hypothetical protein